MRADSNDSSNNGSGSTATMASGKSNISNSNNDAAPMPKHIPFPEFPGGSEVLNELVMFLFITCAAAMQFINIYRTVWWLPESYTKNTVNVYLIEPYLVALIVLLMSRRLIYCLLISTLELLQRSSSKQRRLYRAILKYTFGSLLLVLLSFCVIKIYIRHTFLSLFLLVYPLIVYLLIFGFKIEPFLRSSCEVEGAYFNGMPMHCCSTSPTTIRDEIDVLKNDFNNRFKQIIFTSVVNAYYAGFVPCFFAVSIYYNVLWATQHILFVWLSGFTMATVFVFPAKYSDILHRASLHLGCWSRLESRSSSNGSGIGVASPIPVVWNKNAMWVNGSVIKYSGELFSCQGPVTVAVPGNSSHSRFYRLFHNPSIIYMILTTAQAAIVLIEIMLLYFAIEWHFVLSISFIALTNQFTFFKIMRDYLVTKRIYTAETSISSEKPTTNTLHSN